MKESGHYFDTARSWAADCQLRERRQLRLAWIVAGTATAVAVFEALALVLLTPLKTVQPVTLLVDRQTGYVQALDPLQPRRVGADAALTQSLLAQYVTARESFDRATIGADYRRVALSSTGGARNQYLARMPADNPDSPFRTVPAGWSVTTRVKSVSALSPGVALVRFETARQDRSGRADTGRPWIAIVRYAYSDAPMAFEDRLANPLGFQVNGYRRDAEAPVAVAPTLPPPSAPASDTDGIAIRTNGTAQGNGERTAPAFGGSARLVAREQVPLGSPFGAADASKVARP